MKRFELGLGVLLSLCFVIGGCDTAAKPKPVRVENGSFAAGLPKKSGVVNEDFADDRGVAQVQTQASPANDVVTADAAVAEQSQTVAEETAPQNERITPPTATPVRYSRDGFRPNNEGVLSGGISTISGGSKSTSKGSLDAVATE